MEIFGRKTVLALVLDVLLYTLIVWTTLCYLLRNRSLGIAVATLFSFAIVAFVGHLLYQRSMRARVCLRERIRTDLALDRILLMDEDNAKKLFAPDTVLQKTFVQKDDILDAVRNGTRVLWLCGKPDAEAQMLLNDSELRIYIHPKERTAKWIQSNITDGEVEAEIERRAQRKKKLPPLRELLQSWKPNRFTLLGVLLMGLSFLTAQKLWFRIVASVCFVIGSILYTRSIAVNARASD